MNIAQILQAEFPGAEWVLTGETYEGLEWLSESKKPTEKELEKLSSKVAKDAEAFNIKSMRRRAYQETADPLFFKWQAGEDTENDWKTARAAVDKQFPYSS